jgi:hypothetical protein
MQTEISFQWWRERNPKDYEIKNAGTKPNILAVLHEDWPANEPTIRAKRIALDPYNPLDEFPDLYERFTKIRSEADAIKFVRAYGPLTVEGLNGKGDIIQIIQGQARNMARGWPVAYGLLGLPEPHVPLYATLAADQNGFHLKIEPASLLDALWLQFAEAVSRGLANRCKQCNRLFATGPDAGRRRGAEFCSEQCKIKFHSLKRSRP